MSLDLNKLANKLDEALIKETNETLTKFLTNKRMSNNKQSSSVEWLYDKIILKLYELQKIEYTHIFLEELEQAKAMHKEEHFKTWWHDISENEPISFEQYYKETFGGNNDQQ